MIFFHRATLSSSSALVTPGRLIRETRPGFICASIAARAKATSTLVFKATLIASDRIRMSFDVDRAWAGDFKQHTSLALVRASNY
jgi:hypothetical protein